MPRAAAAADPVPVTCWPTVRSTEATVPEMVEVSDASFRFVCAVESEDSAEVTDASSVSIGAGRRAGGLVAGQAVLGRRELRLRRTHVFGQRRRVHRGQDLARR